MSLYKNNKDKYVLQILDLQNIFNLNEYQRNKLKKIILENISYIKKYSLKKLMKEITN